MDKPIRIFDDRDHSAVTNYIFADGTVKTTKQHRFEYEKQISYSGTQPTIVNNEETRSNKPNLRLVVSNPKNTAR